MFPNVLFYVTYNCWKYSSRQFHNRDDPKNIFYNENKKGEVQNRCCDFLMGYSQVIRSLSVWEFWAFYDGAFSETKQRGYWWA